MTSNIGANLLKKTGSIGFRTQEAAGEYKDMKSMLLEEVKKTFKPEFLNRIDDVIVFHSLSRDHLIQIVEIEVKEVQERLMEKNVEIVLDSKAKEFLIDKGFDKTFGARPLKRTIQRYLENPLAEELLSGTFKDGAKIKITALKEKEELKFEIQKTDEKMAKKQK